MEPGVGLSGSGTSSTTPPVSPTSPHAIARPELKIGQITLADGRKMDVFILLKDGTGTEMNFPTNFNHKAKIEKLCKKIMNELNPPTDAKEITLSNAGLTYTDSKGDTTTKNYTSATSTNSTKHSNYWWDKTMYVIKNNNKKGFSAATF